MPHCHRRYSRPYCWLSLQQYPPQERRGRYEVVRAPAVVSLAPLRALLARRADFLPHDAEGPAFTVRVTNTGSRDADDAVRARTPREPRAKGEGGKRSCPGARCEVSFQYGCKS